MADDSESDTGLPVVSKCRSKDSSQGSTSGSGGCGCKRRRLPPVAPDASGPPSDVTTDQAAVLVPVEPTSAMATMEEPSPPATDSCGCGHHTEESTVPQQAEAAVAAPCKCQKLRWVRRTHSACGLVFGVFVAEHMAATALGLRPQLFEQYIGGVHAGLRQTPWLEILVFLPLLTLVPFGLFLLAKSGLRYDVKKCKRGGKLRFFLQRLSALAILAFIAFHLLTLKDWGPWSAGTEAPSTAVLTTAAAPAPKAFAASVRQVWSFLPSGNTTSALRFAVIAFYLLGTVAVIYHLANGLCTGAIAWNLTPSAALQQRSVWVCISFGILLLVFGVAGWYAFIVTPSLA